MCRHSASSKLGCKKPLGSNSLQDLERIRLKEAENEELLKMPYRVLALKDKTVLITGLMGNVTF